MQYNWFIFFFALLLSLPLNVLGQEARTDEVNKHRSTGNFKDGPYLIHKRKKIELEYIISTDHQIEINKKTYKKKALKKKALTDFSFTCEVDGIPPIAFQIRLMPELEIAPTEYPAPEKLLAISDIEGNFYALKALLLSAGVMDETYNWSYGEGHLVLVGDFFDRGTQVTEVLWLIYELERQAKQKGGKVHFLLGNHEILNLAGFYEYNAVKYLAVSKEMKVEYKNLFNEDTELGRWLRTKNVVEKIGKDLFVHGGISYELVESKLTLLEINEITRQNIALSYNELANTDEKTQLIFGMNGPFWYRGYFNDEEEIKQQLPDILAYFDIDKIIVGHTPANDITSFYDGRICDIDVIQPEKSTDKRNAKALLKENDAYYKVDDKGTKMLLEKTPH